jgi:formylmethanofuran dehydrogenase subunit B
MVPAKQRRAESIEKMSIVVINIWKKGSSRAGAADYHIEVDQGETYEVSALIDAIKGIAKAIKDVER